MPANKIIHFEHVNIISFTFQINASSTDEGLNFYDSGHQFEHLQLLLVLLRSLPFAPKAVQTRALQVSLLCFQILVFLHTMLVIQ